MAMPLAMIMAAPAAEKILNTIRSQRLGEEPRQNSARDRK